jgi:phosphoribosylformylglycinamidine synthase
MSTQVEANPLSSVYFAQVFISLKPAVNDPEGLAIQHGLDMLGFGGVSQVRTGKYLQLTVRANSPEEAHSNVVQMCEKLLANTVIEVFDVTIHSSTSTADEAGGA